MNADRVGTRESSVGMLAGLALQQPRLLLRQSGVEAGDLTSVEAEALALLAFVFWWGRLARPNGGTPGFLPDGFFIGESAGAEQGGQEFSGSHETPLVRIPALDAERAQYAKHAAALLERFRGRGRPEPGADELLAVAARSFVFFCQIACSGPAEPLASRSMTAQREARAAWRFPPSGASGGEVDLWAARWRRVIPLLQSEIAAPHAGLPCPGHVVADLAALRVFLRAATEGDPFTSA